MNSFPANSVIAAYLEKSHSATLPGTTTGGLLYERLPFICNVEITSTVIVPCTVLVASSTSIKSSYIILCHGNTLFVMSQ